MNAKSLESDVCALLVGDFGEDSQLVRDLFRQSDWRLLEANDRRRAMQCLSRNSIHVVVAGTDLDGWNWRSVLRELDSLAQPPQLVLASPHADDRLWAEALNLGAFDVLMQPFDRREVERVIESARRHFDRRPAGMESFGGSLLSAGVA